MTTLLLNKSFSQRSCCAWNNVVLYNVGTTRSKELNKSYSIQSRQWHSTSPTGEAVTRLIPRSRVIIHKIPNTSLSTRRTASSTSIRQPALPKTPPSAPKKSVLANPKIPHKAYQLLLGSKPTATLLYKAPSQATFFTFSYSTALFAFTYGYYNLQTIFLHPPEGLATWVSTSFGGICALMIAMGTYVSTGPYRLVKSISAVPSKGKEPGDFIRIEIELRKMLAVPDVIWPRRVISLKPEECTLEHVLYTPVPEGWEPEQAILPTKGVSKGLYGAGRVFTRSGFLELEARGVKYKIDIAPGAWGLQDGQALDRLIKVKQ